MTYEPQRRLLVSFTHQVPQCPSRLSLYWEPEKNFMRKCQEIMRSRTRTFPAPELRLSLSPAAVACAPARMNHSLRVRLLRNDDVARLDARGLVFGARTTSVASAGVSRTNISGPSRARCSARTGPQSTQRKGVRNNSAVNSAALPMVRTNVAATVPAHPRCGVMPASPSPVRTRLMKSTWHRKIPPVSPARNSPRRPSGRGYRGACCGATTSRRHTPGLPRPP